jgi:hypothetical protein
MVPADVVALHADVGDLRWLVDRPGIVLWAVLCCIVPFRRLAVLCLLVLRRALSLKMNLVVPCCAVLCRAVLCRAVLCC